MNLRLNFIALLSATLLSGCIDKEKRAEEKFNSALEYYEAGDFERAGVELRNALQDNQNHRDARKLFGEILLDQSEVARAYPHYLFLAEQFPDDSDVRRILAEISLDTGEWDEVKRHGLEALELSPSDLRHQALEVMVRYHEAEIASDDLARASIANEARALLDQDPNLDTALRLLVAWTASGPAPAEALPYLERLIERHPDTLSILMARLRAIEASGDTKLLEQRLKELYDQFPENEQVSRLLLRWYFANDKLDDAESFLRSRAGGDDGPFDAHADVLRLVRDTRGDDAVIFELDRLIAANKGTDLGRRYAMQKEFLLFQNGTKRAPEATLSLADSFEDSTFKNEARFVVAQMFEATDQSNKAFELIDQILTDDTNNVDALLARARRSLQAGDHDRAISDTRIALSQFPRNPQALILLANAQQQRGNTELAEQRLAQAVEVSDGAPEPAIVYARFQSARGEFATAERVLRGVVDENLDNIPLVSLLAELQLRLNNTAAARNLMKQLIDRGNPEAGQLIRTIQATILFTENRIEESLNFLRNSLDEDGDGSDDLGAELQILRIQVLSGRYDEAQRQLDKLLERFPEASSLRVIQGNVLSLQGQLDEAIQVFEALLAEKPNQEIIIQRLYALYRQNAENAKATELLVASLDTAPDSKPLILLRALELENEGNIEAALSSYQTLYNLDPTDLTVANNYASSLAYYRDDEASLAIAAEIAEKLSESGQPAIRDTVGYILLRQGKVTEAILNLEAAARGLPDNPTIAFNLAEAYEAAGRVDKAQAQYERGFGLAEGKSDIPKLSEARAAYAALGVDQSEL